MLFEGASHSLAELIYTAWAQAGSPSMAQEIFSPLNESSSIYLGQNQPNPFRNTTLVKYRLPEHSNLSVLIMDITGHVVEDIDNSYLAVHSSFEFDANGLSNGIYFLVMKSEDDYQIRKMVKID
jgi:hypothetical protein